MTMSASLPAVATSAEQEIYEQIREAITSGVYRPGAKLPAERELAEHFGTTRGLVRRAILRLERQRLVTRHVGRGTFVVDQPEGTSLSHRESRLQHVSPVDVLEARMALEPGFADLAVARATEDDLDQLEGLLVSLEKAPTQQEFREAGYAFHLALAKVTRNPLLVNMFELIIEARLAAGWGKLLSLNDTAEARQQQAASNRAILDALRARDGALARKVLRHHLGGMVARVAFDPKE